MVFLVVVLVLVTIMQECNILWDNLQILCLSLCKYATWLIVEHILVSWNVLFAIWWRPHLGTSAPCPGSGSRSRLTTRITSLFHRNRIFPVPSLASSSLQRRSTFFYFFPQTTLVPHPPIILFTSLPSSQLWIMVCFVSMTSENGFQIASRPIIPNMMVVTPFFLWKEPGDSKSALFLATLNQLLTQSSTLSNSCDISSADIEIYDLAVVLAMFYQTLAWHQKDLALYQ